MNFKVVARSRETRGPMALNAVAFEFPPQTHILLCHGVPTQVSLPYLIIIALSYTQPVIAVRNEPITSLDDALYHAPLGNIFHTGHTCNIPVAGASPADIVNYVLRSTFADMYHGMMHASPEALWAMSPEELCKQPWHPIHWDINPSTLGDYCSTLVVDSIVMETV